MFKNYFKTAWRNMRRNKIYSVLNIAGLSIGLACAMLIVLYVKDEVSFDRFHENVNSIFRVVRESKFDGWENKMSSTTGFLQGPRFAQSVSGIKSFVRVQSDKKVIKTDTEIQSQELIYVDSNFFSVFSFPMVNGDATTCLKDPNSVVLSEDAAKRLFGTTDGVGKLVMIKEDTAFIPYKVTAVARRSPQNSSIRFDVLLPFEKSKSASMDDGNWYNFFLNTFIVLDENVNRQSVEKNMQRFYLKDASQSYKAMIDKYGNAGKNDMGSYLLQPFTDMHLSTELPVQNGLTGASNPMYSYILSAIAVFILLIACINFINLTVARSVKRAKEIGIRKVMGSDRKQLIIQFMSESFLLCSISFVLALLLVQSLIPLFNILSNKALALSYLFDVKLVGSYIVLFIITGFLAGFYPALVLSGYNPVRVLYSRFNLAGKNYLQKSLVVLQFALSCFLITGTFIIYAQFSFLTKTNLGYDDRDVIVLKSAGEVSHDKAILFKNELLKNQDILDVAPRGEWGSVARNNKDSAIDFMYETVDESYLPLFKIQILKGRNFSKSFAADPAQSVIVNETFVKKAGWQNPIGETVNFWYQNQKQYQVIGVIQDYHFAALNQAIKPQLFTMKNDNRFSSFFIKIRPKSNTASVKYIQATFNQFFPINPYSYTYKDEDNYNSYKSVEKWKQILLFGAVITIFISCIGLFGLTVLSTEKRTKEIGIRKVLGASVRSVVTILSGDFLKLVMISLLAALPLSWVCASKWLDNYPYRITLNWWMFAGADMLVMLIALVTVSFQAIRAAFANPVKSLRNE